VHGLEGLQSGYPAVTDPEITIEYEATHLRDRRYSVAPKGKLGTMGWTPKPWTAVFVTASSPVDALKRAAKVRANTGRD
jgi:hypothetical protein